MAEGRTIWNILTGKNKPDLKPQELRYFNPLQAKVGSTLEIKNEPTIQGIRCTIDKITIYKTVIGKKTFYHIDHHCKGTSLEMDGFVRFRLRLIPDEDATNETKCRLQLLYLYDELAFDEGFLGVVNDPTGEFRIGQDDAGNQLPEDQIHKYWRVEGLHDPFHSTTTVLEDLDQSGKVDENEIIEGTVTSWEFSRITNDENDLEFVEFLTVEMDDSSKYFIILRGTEVLAGDVFLF